MATSKEEYLKKEVKRLESQLKRSDLTPTQREATERELKFTKIATGSSPTSVGVSVSPSSKTSNIITDSSGRQHIVLESGEVAHELRTGEGNFITIRGKSGFQETFKPEMFKGIRQEITPTGIKTTYLSTSGVISQQTIKPSEGKLYNIDLIKQEAEKQGLKVSEKDGKLIVESQTKYVVGGKGVSPTEAGKTLLQKEKMLKEQRTKQKMVQSFREGIERELGEETREETEPDLTTRQLLIEEYKMQVMEGIERGEFIPSVIGGYATRITPKDPFGLKSIGRIGLGVFRGESVEVIKTDIDKITMEGVEWLAGQTLDQAGRLKEPKSFFVDIVPKTTTGQLAIYTGAGMVAGAGFEALSPTIGKVAGILPKINIPKSIIQPALISIPLGIESYKVGTMVGEGRPPEEIFARVGSDIIYMGGFSGGFQEGKRIYDVVRTFGTKTIPTEQFFEKEIITGEKRFPTRGPEHISNIDRARIHSEQFLKESPTRLPEGKVIGIHATDVDLFQGQKSFVVDEKYFKSELPVFYVAPSGSIHFARISKEPSISLIGSNIDDMFGGRPTLYAFKPIEPEVQIALAERIPNVPSRPLGWKFKGSTTEGIIQVAGIKTESEGGFIAGTKFINPKTKYSVEIFGRKVPIVTAEAVKGIESVGSIPDININPLKAGSVPLYEELGISKSVYLISPESSIAVSLASIGRPSPTSKGVSSDIVSPSVISPSIPSASLVLSGPSPTFEISIPSSPISTSTSAPTPSISPSISPPISPITTPPSSPPISPPKAPILDIPELFTRRKGKKGKGIKSWDFNIDLGYAPDIGSLFIGRTGVINPDKIFTGVEIRPVPIPKFKGVSI